MIHPRPFEFTNAEIASLDKDHMQLFDLAEFLRTDPRPQAEGKFKMSTVSFGFNQFLDDASEALSHCGTAACACGWEAARSGDNDLFGRAPSAFGVASSHWMFGGGWISLDNTPFGAAFRILHYVKHQNRGLYTGMSGIYDDMKRHYPTNPFWLEATQ